MPTANRLRSLGRHLHGGSGPTLVVGEDEDDIGAPDGGGLRGQAREEAGGGRQAEERNELFGNWHRVFHEEQANAMEF